MSEQDQNELKQQLEEKQAALENEQQARTVAEEEAKKAKEAKAAAEEEAKKAKEAKAAAEEEAKKAKEAKAAAEGKDGEDVPASISDVFPTITYYLIIAMFVLFIMYKVFFGRVTMLNELRDVAFARGLITFIFSLGTICIGFILTVGALSKGEEAGKAFTRGKEVFTILVGILGTIVGFYFGSPVESKKTELSRAALTVAAIQASNEAPKENTQITLSTEIRGGTLPYEIAIGFEPKIIPPIGETRNSEGKFEKQLALPEVDKNEKVKIELLVSDGSGKEAKAESTTITIENVESES